MVAKSSRAFKSETDIAVLQVRVNNVEEKFDDIKQDLENVATTVRQNAEATNLLFRENAETTTNLLREVQRKNEEAHAKVERKISALEKWRWMMMGAGIVIGALGFDTIAKLLK